MVKEILEKYIKTATTTQQFQRCLHPLTGGTSTASLEHGPRPRAKQQKQASEAEVAAKKFEFFFSSRVLPGSSLCL